VVVMTTLYVSDVKTSIKLASRHLDVFRDNEKRSPVLQRRFPLHCIDRVTVVGRTRVSMRAVHEFMHRDIPVYVLDYNGHHAGSFLPHRDGDALLRIRQYQQHESEWALDCARRIVQEKIQGARRVLQRVAARHPDDDMEERIKPALQRMKALAARTPHVSNAADLRGAEGAASAAYFDALGTLLPTELSFRGRNRRPPRDPVNALLSWSYSLVSLEMRGAIVANGLDPCIGIYHGLGYGRPALALDLMEPFRAPLCDLLVIRLFNLGIIKTVDFTLEEEQGCRLEPAGRAKFFEQYEKRMTTPFHVRGEEKPTTFRELIRRTAYAYRKALQSGQILEPFEVR
jgi:CRISP-associated protein Cas1